MNEKEMEEKVPDELYAPLGDVTFEKPKKQEEPEILSYKNVKLEYSEKPFNTKKMIITMVSIVILFVILVASYAYLTNKKNILYKGISYTSSSIGTTFSTLKNNSLTHFSTKTPFKTSILVSFNSSYDKTLITKEEKDLLDTLKSVNLSETLQIDYSKKQFTHLFKSNYTNGNILTVRANGNENTISYTISEVLGKYIEQPLDTLELFYRDTQTEQTLLNNASKRLGKGLITNIKKNDIKQQKTTITIGDKNYKVKELSLVLNKEMIQNILNEETFKNNILDYTYLDEKTYLQYINDLENIEFSVYAKGITNTILGFKITFKQEDTITLTYLKHKNSIKISCEKNNATIFSLEKIKDKNQEKIKISYKDFLLNIESSNQTTDTVYNYQLTNQQNISYTGTITKSEEVYKNAIDGNVHITMKNIQDETEISNLTITINYNVKEIDEIELYDVFEKVTYDSLPSDITKEIKNKVLNSTNFKLVKEKIDNYLSKK
jgi:hypothetical protein